MKRSIGALSDRCAAPPSTVTTVPLTYDARGDARKGHHIGDLVGLTHAAERQVQFALDLAPALGRAELVSAIVRSMRSARSVAGSPD